MNHKKNRKYGGKTITVHGLSREAAELLARRAKTEGLSVNKVMKEMIDRGLGIDSGKDEARARFAEFGGLWTAEEAEQFLASVGDMDRIDEADWR